MTNVQYNKLKKFMSDSSFTFTDEWLTACFSWVKENFSANQITDQFLKDQIFEQWLGTDLEEMESSCLPGSLDQKKCMKLTGRFGLQINSLQDISESSYSQLNKLQKTVNENTSVEARDSNHCKPSWEPKPRRCLYLSMTDGSQKVFGLEMTSIPSVTLAVKPGAKVLIIGPVECRRGVLQLKPVNVQLLGGEVELLASTNSIENVLARNLHQPENPNAEGGITESQLNRLANNSTNTTQSQSQQQSRININTNHNHANNDHGEFPDDDDDFEIATADAFSDDDLFMDIDESALIASASTGVNNAETQVIAQNSFVTEPVNSFYHPNSSRRRSNDAELNSTIIEIDSDPEPAGNSSRRSRNAPSEVAACFTKDKSIVKPVFKNPSSTSAKEKTVTKTPGFKNAKSELGKQLKIEKYLKPMPLVIDPPTPEREARKRLKRAEKDKDSTLSVEENGTSSKVVAVVDPVPNIVQREEIEPEDDSSNDSLMDLVESSINEQLKNEEINNIDSVIPSVSSTSVSSNKITSPISVSKHPYVFLKQIHEDWDRHCSTRKVFHVKACISTLLSSLRMEEGQWTLDACINDGSGFLNCTISSVLLNEVIGFTPAEMKQLKKRPDGKAKIAKSMKDLTGTLVHWNGIFGIEVGTNPLVVSYSEIMIHHIAALKERLSHLL